MTGTVTIDRAEFDEIVIELGGLADFIIDVYASGDMDSMAWKMLWGLSKRLREAAGLPLITESDDEAETRFEREREIGEKLKIAYARSQFPEAFQQEHAP